VILPNEEHMVAGSAWNGIILYKHACSKLLTACFRGRWLRGRTENYQLIYII